MISKSTTKLIKSLAIKKIRHNEKLFLVEGDKNVTELLDSKFEIIKLLATSEFIAKNQLASIQIDFAEVSKEEIKKASLLKNPQNSMAICKIPDTNFTELPDFNLALYLDFIQDPGNFGTIVRICDWFGIENLFCSPDSVDFYNPKTIQATMGSFCRVNIFYKNLNEIAPNETTNSIKVYGTYLEGKSLFETVPEKKTLIVIGNEGNGIRNKHESLIHEKINIPSFSIKGKGAESLNAGVAAGIICAHFKQKVYSK